ncbi:sulfur oxidation c-type cytochrome SoxA [Henriciella sp.]|uniref:sulfur oxidation c-type cytochrome SoxA n=1 Tax=Henriciella sp. TaxID=1968823 RepID=UPI0017E16508|nr:sulfur oxidation c-type cytochrome SoxA [Henriciella sp.]HIG23218.1 sulfur oxidation c-type cytochrome SoxA [Henriciella sp.]
MKAGLAFLSAICLTACGDDATSTQSPPAQPQPLQSGYEFLQPQTQALQDDDFANPGFLWIDRGEALFTKAAASGEACSDCHTDTSLPLAGAAAHYPQIDSGSSDLINLEGRINLCRTRHQDEAPLEYESDELLSLTAYVAYLSRGTPISVDIEGAASDWYARGRDYFEARRGQFNLSCTQCHDDNWGKKLRGDTISQGHGTGFPAYRLEWQSLGSLHRRLRDCDAGVRAEPRPFGSADYLAVELYLAKRAEGLEVETPGVRR